MSSRQYLVADPDAGQRQLLDLLLADGETTIAAVESARQTLEFLRSNTPALVVLAYELPDMPGVEVCKRIKLVARLQHVPVIVTVEPNAQAGVIDRIRSEADATGVDLLVPKPLGDKALRDRANRLLSGGDGRHAAHVQRVKHDTGVIDQSLKELEARQHGPGQEVATTPAPAPSKPAADNGDLEHLRAENAKLKKRVLGQLDTIAKLQAELDEMRRANKRGLFGRRRGEQ